MKTYLVTGGAQGIGQAITEALLREGNAVHVIDKQSTKYIAENQAATPDKFKFYLQDIAEREALQTVLEGLKGVKFDGVINNAGEVYLEKWHDFSIANWDRTMSVNVTAPMQIVHALGEQLNKGGAVVNIASSDALVGAFDAIAYAASKAALISLTKSLAVNLGPAKVRVNAVAPGWVATEMTKDSLPDEAKELVPMKQIATSEDIANVVTFLLSDKATAINGALISADDGLSIVDYTLWAEAQPDYNK